MSVANSLLKGYNDRKCMINVLFLLRKFNLSRDYTHEFTASLFSLYQSLTTTRFCREIKQNAVIRVDIEKLLGYMYLVNLTSKSQFLVFQATSTSVQFLCIFDSFYS